MHIQNLLSSLLYPISTIIFIIITSSSISYADEDAQFFNCSTPFRCGEYFQEINYPFWGGNRSQECGLPGFQLSCQQNDYLNIDIASQTFRVLNIDETNRSLIIVRNDLWDDICPEKYHSTELNNDATFRYGQDVDRLNLFYFCPSIDFPVRNNYICNTDGNRSTGFFADESFSSVRFLLEECEFNITVPVLESALENFRSNPSMTLQELLNQGFPVEYDINATACLACTRSGGLCWSRIDSEILMCLCPDGAHEYICPGNGGLFIFLISSSLSTR